MNENGGFFSGDWLGAFLIIATCKAKLIKQLMIFMNT